MSLYLITSREGLFVCDIHTKNLHLLKDGFFFGLSKYKDVWYISGFYGDKESERTFPTFKGYIASFKLKLHEHDNVPHIHEWKEECSNLDNGSHQLRVYNKKVYLIETYIQTISVFRINDDFSLTFDKSKSLHPPNKTVMNAHYIINSGKNYNATNDQNYTCHGYKHINALTFHDNFIYMSCPNLRNGINADGKPTQSLSPHTIEVYDLEFNFLWSFIIANEIFCHDIVFQGHKLYFGAPPNKLCSFDIVSRKSHVVKQFNIPTMHPRGLSIDKKGTIVMGFKRPQILSVTNIEGDNIEYIEAPCSPCFIAKIDYNDDFNNCISPLVHPYVAQIPTDIIPIDTNSLQSIANIVFGQDWSKFHDKRKNNSNQGANDGMLLSTTLYTVDDIKEPCNECFAHLHNIQRVACPKIHLSELIVTGELKDMYLDILSLFSMFVNNSQKLGLNVTGKLYLYPAKSGMGWHTNLEDPRNIHSIRCYLLYTTEDNSSFFFYKHPISGLIHAIPDRNGYANVFDMGHPQSPLWHAIYNNSHTAQRLSIGIAFYKNRMSVLHTLKNIVNAISH
jgi:hypothetical protein